MANTTNFGWETPDDTDLVKDGASAIRTLGSAIDTSLVDLKGGTTGQVLSKASNTDMDFTWSSVDPLTILDAKGDLISATAADSPARLAVGTNGQLLTADSTTSTGLKWADAPAAGAYTQLATGTLSTVQVSITSISSAYNDLFLVINNPYINTGSPNLAFRLNGRTDAVHQVTAMRSDNTTLVSYPGGGASNANALPSADARQLGTATTDYVYCALKIERYASSNTRKVMQMTYGATDIAIQSVGYFYAVDAISSIQIRTSNGTSTFSGGTYTLWGIK